MSSNLERLIYDVENRDAEKVKAKMQSLSETGRYEVDKNRVARLRESFYANFCAEETCAETIGNFFEEYEYVLDPHTAVAMSVYDGYACEYPGEARPAVILSIGQAPINSPRTYTRRSRERRKATPSRRRISWKRKAPCPFPNR